MNGSVPRLWHDRRVRSAVAIVLGLLSDLVGWIGLQVRQRRSLEAEVLFLRRQLALYVERRVKPRRVDAATRVSLMLLSRLFNWRSALVVVRPETMIRWHRMGWGLFWRPKSRPGRPSIPPPIQALIHRIAGENPLWGEERIANELLLKLGIRVSPRTVRKYLPWLPRDRAFPAICERTLAILVYLVEAAREVCAGTQKFRASCDRETTVDAPLCISPMYLTGRIKWLGGISNLLKIKAEILHFGRGDRI